MGQQQSKEELLHQQVNYGNIEGIKSLCRDGAGLEWIDREGKTPLIVACMKPELFNVAKTLLELGANVNYYRPGRNGGTPLHHAAKRGLDHTVKLLLSHGANALVINDDCQTALDVARTKAFTNVVRAIESHMCLFAGWMREFYGPGFLEVLAPQLLSRKIWVVVYPCGSRNPTKPFKLELAIYSGLQDAQPRSIIALWKANLEEPKFYHTDTSVIIVDNSSPTISKGRKRRRIIYTSQEGRCRPRSRRQTRIKLAPGQENDRVQLQLFCDACKGIAQTMPPAFQHSAQPPMPATAPPAVEDMELAMAINASIESAMHEMPPPLSGPTVIDTSASTSGSVPSGKLTAPAPAPAPLPETSGVPILPKPVPSVESTSSAPSAPPVDTQIVEDGPVQYPSIDSSPIDFTSHTEEKISKSSSGGKEDGTSGSCVICLDAPVEGACIPCGHMAGCMSCLKEIQGKKWGCPVCRAKIDQVIRLYAV